MKSGNQELSLPAGFRFHPTDEELVVHYLCRKCAGDQIPASVVAEIDLYKFDPWDLPGMSLYGEKEWYFFSPRDRKYPNGSRPNRTAGRGYWKATGADKPVGRPKTLAIKKALVFYAGKSPRGVKTNWIMHEYRLANVDRSAAKKTSSRLDDWVLCRLYNKKGTIEKHYACDFSDIEEEKKPREILLLDNDDEDDEKPPPALPVQLISGDEYAFLGTAESDPKLHSADCSSSSDRSFSPEVQSGGGLMDFDFLTNFDAAIEETQYDDQVALFEEMFGYMRTTPFV